MRIAVLAHLHHRIAEPFLGGTEMHTSMVANEFARRGHDVTLFAKEDSVSEARLQPVLEAGFEYAGDSRSTERVHGASLDAIEQIRRGGFDVVFDGPGTPWAVVLGADGLLAGGPVEGVGPVTALLDELQERFTA